MAFALSLQLSLEVPPALPIDLTQRIHDCRYSGKLSDCARDVLYQLVDHPSGPRAGKDKALRISDMQAAWMRNGVYVWPERSIKGAVKQLIEEHEVPIGSSRSSNCSGYFLLQSTSDIEAAERPLRAEIISLAKRLRTINPRSSFAQHLAGQAELNEES